MTQPHQPPPTPEPGWALFLDVDGTLLEIAATPQAVAVSDRLIDLLATLKRRHGGAVALVSGRPLGQLDALFRPVALPMAGLHGLERRDGEGRFHPAPAAGEALERLRVACDRFAAARRGLMLEEKSTGLALHYREVPEAEQEVRGFARRLLAGEDGRGYELLQGKMLVELRPEGAGKGHAIARFMAEPPFAGRTPAFAGDDVTDEDGFAEVNRMNGISVRVGENGDSTARWRLPSVTALIDWLHGPAAAA